MRYLIIACTLVGSLALAEEPADCASVENARERLMCFDRLFPTPDRPAPPPQLRTESVKPSAARVPDRSAPEAPAAQDAADAPPPSLDDPLPERGLFDTNAAVDLHATVKAVRTRDKQKMVFLLSNDQIWIQDSPRNLPIKPGDTVTVKNGSVGGYILTTDGGTTTRVHRIK